MTATQFIAGSIFAAVTLVLSLVFGIRNWRELRGKVIAVASGLALVSLVTLVAFVAVAAIILPGMIALP